MADPVPPRDRKELYDRIARGGKDEVILEEMQRLGFWPATPLPSDPPDETQRMADLRKRLGALREQASRLRNLRTVEAELKKQRLAESKKKREQNKQQKLADRAVARAATVEKKTKDLTYLGKGVSGGLGKRDSDAARLATNGLPHANSASDLATHMRLALGQVRFLAYARAVSTVTHYHRFTIPKRTGGVRVISAPHRRLKAAQHWILEHLLEKLVVSDQAHGFVAGRSTVSNALPHVGAAVVINVDLKDFFPTVTVGRVKGLFVKLGYGEEVATVLALICTEADTQEAELDGVRYFVARGPRRLPQGAPTSPAITNALCRRLDKRIAGYAARYGFVFTRYADDLTLSSKDPAAPVGKALQFLRHVVAAEGFAVHPDKIRVVRRGRRQEVTGVVVNERPGVPRDELRRFRALLHQIGKTGPGGKTWGPGGAEVFAAALGFASYVAMVDRAKGEALRKQVLALKAKWP